MYKFIYKNKNGQKVYSHVELKDKDLVLISQVKNGMIKSKEVVKKAKK